MTEIRKGDEPAFPGAVNTSAPQGMTLRDWFAGQALAAIITATSEGRHDPGLDKPEKLHVPIGNLMASDAYEMADAMLKERAK